MKKYVGDISREDAELLEDYTHRANAVLEFGVGGSTQVIAQSLSDGAHFLSIDTHEGWIETTRGYLRRLGVENRCRFGLYRDWLKAGSAFDLIFDDGVDELRREFAIRSFPHLTVGGFMLFHDTRRLGDVENVLTLVKTFFEEIEYVHLNERVKGKSSNISVVKKKTKEPYVNWQMMEGKLMWAYGYGSVPEDFWL